MSVNDSQSTKSALIGAFLAFFILAIDVFLLDDPFSGEYKEEFLPYLLVPFAGAVGGVLYFLLNRINFKNNQLAILVNFFSVLLYLFLVLLGYAMGKTDLF